MSLENSRVLHKHFLDIGRKDLAEQQEKNYPELKVKEESKQEDSKPKESKQKEEKRQLNVTKPKG